MLAAQGILTYCVTRPLPYHLYADEGALLVLPTFVTSASLSKTGFLTDCKTRHAKCVPGFCYISERKISRLLTIFS